MQFDQGVFPIEYNVLYPQVVDPLLAVFARDAFPFKRLQKVPLNQVVSGLSKQDYHFPSQRTLMANSLVIRMSQVMNPILRLA